MKLVTAIIAPDRLAAVKDALTTFGIMGLTISQVWERGRERPHAQIYRGRLFRNDLRPHLRLDVIALDIDADDILHIITTVAAGQPGNGNAWVSPVEYLIRVRTGEAGTDAL